MRYYHVLVFAERKHLANFVEAVAFAVPSPVYVYEAVFVVTVKHEGMPSL